MDIVNTITSIIEQWNRKTFYIAIGVFISTIYLLHGLIIYRFYSKKEQALVTLEEINNLRATQVKSILARAQKVKHQQKTVDTMLKEEEYFNIDGYMEKLINDDIYGLKNKTLRRDTATIDLNNRYIEQTATAQFGAITMQDLTTLLSSIDQKARVYTKDLEITSSKKQPHTIDVSITIATLKPKK